MFPKPPVIRFAPENDICLCGGRHVVQKTRRKTVLSLTGPFIAHETVRQCQDCRRIAGSDTLLGLVPSRCNVAYDVLIFVGLALFQRHRTTEEVRAELVGRNVRICTSEIAWLGRKFITMLALAHRSATPRIRQTMSLSGGYILHLDATHDGDAPALMTGIDSLSSIVLGNVKLPSEHADHIVPFLRGLQADYGAPRACVHDMGLGICKAVAEVFPGIHDFVCHFHFLRDIGKDFLEPAYDVLRKRLKSHAASSRLHALVREARQGLEQDRDAAPALLVKNILTGSAIAYPELLPFTLVYMLALWALQGKHSGDGYGFPFDRPLLAFAQRLLILNRRLPEFMELLPDDDGRGRSIFSKLARELSAVASDPALRLAAEELLWRGQLFDCLREAMRIAPPAGNNGLNDEGTAEAIASIRQGVVEFRNELEIDPSLSADPLCRKMAEQIDKYGDRLFADPIEVDTPNGKVTIYPQRTNNILEQFFRGIRRAHRRKTGNDSMGRTLQTMLADTPLVKNLDNPAYMEVLLNGKTSLEERFAELDATPMVNTADFHAEFGRMLPGFRTLVTQQTLPEKIIHAAKSQPCLLKSN